MRVMFQTVQKSIGLYMACEWKQDEWLCPQFLATLYQDVSNHCAVLLPSR